MFSKIDVNGPGAHPLYVWLQKSLPADANTSGIQWNFEKFLVDRLGKPVKRFEPNISPLSMVQDIERLL